MWKVDVQLIFKNIRRNKNKNLKKPPSQAQHIVIDLKMELLVKIGKTIHFRCVTGCDYTSDYSKSNIFFEQRNSYITVFWNGDPYYPTGILPVPSQQ